MWLAEWVGVSLFSLVFLLLLVVLFFVGGVVGFLVSSACTAILWVSRIVHMHKHNTYICSSQLSLPLGLIARSISKVCPFLRYFPIIAFAILFFVIVVNIIFHSLDRDVFSHTVFYYRDIFFSLAHTLLPHSPLTFLTKKTLSLAKWVLAFATGDRYLYLFTCQHMRMGKRFLCQIILNRHSAAGC